MNRLRSPVTRSFEARVSDTSKRARRNEIASVRSAPHRAGLLAIHRSVLLAPTLFAQVFKLTDPPPELERLGEGMQSVVYREMPQGNVLKLIKETDANYNPRVYSPRERRRLARELESDHEVMADYLGGVVSGHSHTVEPHPLEDRDTISIRQQYADLDYLKTGDPRSETLKSMLGKVKQTKPHVITQLASLVDNSLRMGREQQLWTDIVGTNNLGICRETDNLVIIDSQPVPPSRPFEQEIAQSQLEIFGSALEAVI